MSQNAEFEKVEIALSLRFLLGDGTAASGFAGGQEWTRSRHLKKISLARKLNRFEVSGDGNGLPVITTEDERPFDAFACMHDLFFKQVWVAGFGCSFGREERAANWVLRRTAPHVAWAMKQKWFPFLPYFDRSLVADQQLWRLLPLQQIRRLGERADALDFLIQRLMENPSGASSSWGEVLRQVAVQASWNEAFHRFSLVGLLLASYENSAAVAAWLLWLLARHPHWQTRVVRGLQEGKWSSLEWCLNETLRLFPPVWSMARVAKSSVVLGDAVLDAGAVVFISPWVQGRLAALWPQPTLFQPQRWQHDVLSPGTFFPFGFGPRGCPGETLARSQLLDVVAALLRDWQFDPAPRRQPTPLFGLTLRPLNGVWLMASPRLKNR